VNATFGLSATQKNDQWFEMFQPAKKQIQLATWRGPNNKSHQWQKKKKQKKEKSWPNISAQTRQQLDWDQELKNVCSL